MLVSIEKNPVWYRCFFGSRNRAFSSRWFFLGSRTIAGLGPRGTFHPFSGANLLLVSGRVSKKKDASTNKRLFGGFNPSEKHYTKSNWIISPKQGWNSKKRKKPPPRRWILKHFLGRVLISLQTRLQRIEEKSLGSNHWSQKVMGISQAPKTDLKKGIPWVPFQNSVGIELYICGFQLCGISLMFKVGKKKRDLWCSWNSG